MKKLQYNITALLIPFLGVLLAQPSMLNEDAVRNSQVSSYEAINSPHLDFSPVIYGDGLVFIGNKEKGEVFDQEINEAYFELKYLPLNSESATISNFSPALNVDNVHKGPCAFSQQDRVIYYTKERRFRDDRNAVLKILKAYKDEADWIPDGEFPFNSDDFSNMHPSLSPDGSFMIFSSNREGGIGGYDLYISRYENGYWKEPENLGSAINSFGDESFPFIHENGSLIFSSDGRGGFGDLDLFVSRKEKQIWKLAQNLGEPFNSKADDFGMTIRVEGNSGFFTSNRKGGKGKDDIYEFSSGDNIFNTEDYVQEAIEDNFQFSTVILDKGNKRPMKDVEVYAIPIRNEGSDFVLSNFNIKSIDVVSEGEEIVMNLEPKEGAMTRYLNISDENGKASFLLDRNKRYFLFAQKKGFKSSQTAIDAKTIVPEITLLLANDRPPVVTPSPVVRTSVLPSSNVERALDRRELVVFDEIYYDYNSANLKSGATQELDLLADYLIKNPQLRVELSSYTDARGPRDYNQSLSTRRAGSAKLYLVRRGISDFRVVASGKGENNIRNHCSNGVTCSDAEHEYNRRTEVRILDN